VPLIEGAITALRDTLPPGDRRISEAERLLTSRRPG
jgi:hypothetical protein